MTPEGLERLMRAIDNLYGVDYPPCANCGHAPREHGRAAMQCQAYRRIPRAVKPGWGTAYYQDTPCTCDCYDEPEESRRTHGYTRTPLDH